MSSENSDDNNCSWLCCGFCCHHEESASSEKVVEPTNSGKAARSRQQFRFIEQRMRPFYADKSIKYLSTDLVELCLRWVSIDSLHYFVFAGVVSDPLNSLIDLISRTNWRKDIVDKDWLDFQRILTALFDDVLRSCRQIIQHSPHDVFLYHHVFHFLRFTAHVHAVLYFSFEYQRAGTLMALDRVKAALVGADYPNAPSEAPLPLDKKNDPFAGKIQEYVVRLIRAIEVNITVASVRYGLPETEDGGPKHEDPHCLLVSLVSFSPVYIGDRTLSDLVLVDFFPRLYDAARQVLQIHAFSPAILSEGHFSNIQILLMDFSEHCAHFRDYFLYNSEFQNRQIFGALVNNIFVTFSYIQWALHFMVLPKDDGCLTAYTLMSFCQWSTGTILANCALFLYRDERGNERGRHSMFHLMEKQLDRDFASVICHRMRQQLQNYSPSQNKKPLSKPEMCPSCPSAKLPEERNLRWTTMLYKDLLDDIFDDFQAPTHHAFRWPTLRLLEALQQNGRIDQDRNGGERVSDMEEEKDEVEENNTASSARRKLFATRSNHSPRMTVVSTTHPDNASINCSMFNRRFRMDKHAHKLPGIQKLDIAMQWVRSLAILQALWYPCNHDPNVHLKDASDKPPYKGPFRAEHYMLSHHEPYLRYFIAIFLKKAAKERGPPPLVSELRMMWDLHRCFLVVLLQHMDIYDIHLPFSSSDKSSAIHKLTTNRINSREIMFASLHHWMLNHLVPLRKASEEWNTADFPTNDQEFTLRQMMISFFKKHKIYDDEERCRKVFCGDVSGIPVCESDGGPSLFENAIDT